MSRRLLIGTVGSGSAGLALIAAGQSVGGPFRRFAILAPRGGSTDGDPNGFPVNKTALGAQIEPEQIGPDWRLRLVGASEVELSREDLLALEQRTATLPIACVEGWSTTQEWTGVPLAALAAMAGSDPESNALVDSVQKRGLFNQATLAASQVAAEDSLLALKVTGVDLSPDHGFPARIIVPALPGVHCTKWVGAITFMEA